MIFGATISHLVEIGQVWQEFVSAVEKDPNTSAPDITELMHMLRKNAWVGQ